MIYTYVLRAIWHGKGPAQWAVVKDHLEDIITQLRHNIVFRKIHIINFCQRRSRSYSLSNSSVLCYNVTNVNRRVLFLKKNVTEKFVLGNSQCFLRCCTIQSNVRKGKYKRPIKNQQKRFAKKRNVKRRTHIGTTTCTKLLTVIGAYDVAMSFLIWHKWFFLIWWFFLYAIFINI